MSNSFTQKPVVAVFVGTYLPYSQTFVYEQLKRQTQVDYTVFAYGRDPGERFFPYEKVCALSTLQNLSYQTVNYAPAFEQEMDRIQPALIHAHFGLNGALAAKYARKRNIPLVITFHGHDVPGLLAQNRWKSRYFRYQRTAKAMFEQADLLLPASQELYDLLCDPIGAPADKMRIHRLGN
jgi:glycosyltransferase involved in cell wall biosynthesis